MTTSKQALNDRAGNGAIKTFPMTTIKQLFTVLFFLSFTTYGHAQIGLTGGYRFNYPSEWMLTDPGSAETIEVIGDGPSIGIDYWFRLKNKRVEFLPELNYARFERRPVVNFSTELTTYSFFFNIHLYPFDFGSDCDCPTFSKQGHTLEKGFFLRLSPGLSLFQQDFTLLGETTGDNSLAFSVAGGAGFDFGVADLLTISPLVELRYFPSLTWTGLAAVNEAPGGFSLEGEEGHLLQLMAGLRLGLRLDYR